jgi:hypothetical protein
LQIAAIGRRRAGSSSHARAEVLGMRALFDDVRQAWRVRALFVAVVVAGAHLIAQNAKDGGPPTPFEDVGACPFEGCVYRVWTANRRVQVRTDRREGAPIAFAVKTGEKVTAITGVVVTISAGRVQFRQPQDLTSSDGPIRVVPGQTLYLLTYQGEGYTKAWFNGRLYRDVDTATFFNGVCDFNPDRCTGRIVEKSQTVWWVRVRNASGRIGWTSEPDAFDGRDALGG